MLSFLNILNFLNFLNFIFFQGDVPTFSGVYSSLVKRDLRGASPFFQLPPRPYGRLPTPSLFKNPKIANPAEAGYLKYRLSV